jgi:nucleotide-binding universal stress UspA family protein
VSPVERPVASAAYSFVRFIGGGLAPYVAGRLVLAVNIHFPFYLGAAAVVLGIFVLASGHKLLATAERAQAESVPAESAPAESVPIESMPVSGVTAAAAAPAGAERRIVAAGANGAPGLGVIVGGAIIAAVDGSPTAGLVTDAAARLAAGSGRLVHVVHAQEDAIGGDTAANGESLDAARAVVRGHLSKLADMGVPAEGHVLLHSGDHGIAGKHLAEYANEVGATTIFVGAPSHNGLASLMDESASAELRRHAKAHILVVNPDASSTADTTAARG